MKYSVLSPKLVVKQTLIKWLSLNVKTVPKSTAKVDSNAHSKIVRE